MKRASALRVLGLVGALISAAAAHAAPAQLASATHLKRLSLEELMSMDVTTASRRPEAFSTTASAISVLTGDDVRRSGATTLADALRWSTGLGVARADGRTWAVASRGFNITSSNKLLVMMDGRSLYTPLFAGVLWDAQDTELADLDRIEVVRGPGATLWGANAVNGVINIQTKNARDTQGSLVTAGAGTEERAFGSARYGFTPTTNVFARVYVKNYHRDDLVFPNGTDSLDDSKMNQGGFRLDYAPPASANTATVQGDIYQGFLGASNRLESRIAGGNLLARWKHAFTPDRSLQTQLYYDRIERSVPLQFSERRDTVDFETHFASTLGERQHVLVGFTARTSEDHTGSNGTVRFSPTSRTISVVSGLIQDEIALFDNRLGVTLGAKFEHNNSSGTEFQPSIRAAWHPTEQQTVWAAVSRAIRAPTRFDDDIRVGATPTTTLIRGDTAFESEKLTACELGYRIAPHRSVSLDVSLFANKYDDLRSQERSTTPGPLFVLRNKLNATTSGGEASVSVQVASPWRLRATYAHLRKELTLDPGSTDSTRGTQEGNDPRHIATLTSTLDLAAHWEFDTMVRYVSELPNPVVPAYTTLDLRLGWQPTPAWDLSVVAQNLLDSKHREFGARSATAREVERAYYARLTWHF